MQAFPADGHFSGAITVTFAVCGQCFEVPDWTSSEKQIKCSNVLSAYGFLPEKPSIKVDYVDDRQLMLFQSIKLLICRIKDALSM